MQIKCAWTVSLCLTIAGASATHAKDPDKVVRHAATMRALTVEARAIERPLMKYRLFPAEYELHDGNAAPILLRLPWEQTPYFSKVVPTFGAYLDLPLNDPKLLGAKDIFLSSFYRALKRAAYRRTAEWEYPIGEEPAATILLPDVQGGRAIVGNGLSVWIRQHIARGQLAEAREAILVGLANSRHYARTPFVITQLVAAHLDSMMLARLEELLSQHDCPNLYWALSALPRPFIDLRPSIELEQRFLEMSVPGLDDLRQLQTEDQWTRRASAVFELFSSEPSKSSADQLIGGAAKAARAALPDWIEGGASRVAKMSDAEAVLRWFLHKNQEQAQEATALMSLDPQAAIPRLAGLQKRIRQFYSEFGAPALYVVANTPHSYLAAHGIERRIDALRTVEAIRDYAASHNRQLPISLDKIVEPPVPNDPLTGKPFQYKVNGEVAGDAATLSAPGIPADDSEFGEIRYQIKLHK